MDDIQAITALIQDVGVWAVFFYLFIDERRKHQSTRREYREDLRDIAGLQRHLSAPQQDLNTALIAPRPGATDINE